MSHLLSYDDRPIISGSYQRSASMGVVQGHPHREIHLDPHHRGPQLMQTQPADIPRILEELSSLGEVYNQHVLTSMLQSCNALNTEINTVKSSNESILSRMAQFELSQQLSQVEHLDLAQLARKREKGLRLDAIKGIESKWEMSTLIDLEYLIKDQDKVLESLHPNHLDGLLRGTVTVPQSGYVETCGPALTEKALSGLVSGHIRLRTCVFDQIRVLEAVAKSSLGKDVIPHLQPNWDHFNTGTLEEKEAFDERQQSQKGAQGSRGSALLIANLSQPLKAGANQAARGAGGNCG